MRDLTGSLRGTAPGLRPDVQARLTRLEGANPEWGAALAAVREVLAAVNGAPFAVLTRVSDGVPRLAGATITVSSEALVRLIERLDSASGLGGSVRWLGTWRDQLESAIRETGDVTPVARFAAIPVLTHCAAQLEREHDGWSVGFCPVCAAWPLLAETRGLERGRWLRCGRCGAGWRGELLRCVFCGERDHTRLGTLAPRGDRKAETGGASVETCSSCHGYLKTVTTLGPLDGAELRLTDFETVELDLAARDAGFARPAGLGSPLAVTISKA